VLSFPSACHISSSSSSSIVSCHRRFLPGTSLEPAVIPTTQASSFTLQYFPYYVWCSKYRFLCCESIECFPGTASKFFLMCFVLLLLLLLLLSSSSSSSSSSSIRDSYWNIPFHVRVYSTCSISFIFLHYIILMTLDFSTNCGVYRYVISCGPWRMLIIRAACLYTPCT